MEKLKITLVALLTLFLSACEWSEPYAVNETEIEPETNVSADLIMRVAQGFNSDYEMYIQRGVNTWMNVKDRSGKKIKLVIWEIDNKKFFGQEIIYKSDKITLVNISIEAEYDDGSIVKSDFKLNSVYDIAEFDPVKTFVLDNGIALVLISKERITTAVNKSFQYVGTMTDWVNRSIPTTDHNYIIKNGQPEAVSDVGKYIGIRFPLVVAENKLALIYSDKFADNIWADLSGSQFVKVDENPGIIIFDYNGKEIVPLGDSQKALPGTNGDTYFRFSKKDGMVDIYFNFDQNISTKSFLVKRNDDGIYSSAITVKAVSDFPKWGMISLPWEEISTKVLYLRAGENKEALNVFSENLKKSRFYSDFYNALVLSAAEF